MPTEDDGRRDDPLLSGTGNAITAYRPDVAALQAARPASWSAVGVESREVLTGRATAAFARPWACR